MIRVYVAWSGKRWAPPSLKKSWTCWRNSRDNDTIASWQVCPQTNKQHKLMAKRSIVAMVAGNSEIPETWRFKSVLCQRLLRRTWKSSKLIWIAQTTHYSFCRLSYINSKLPPAPSLTDYWTLTQTTTSVLVTGSHNVCKNLLDSTSGPKDHLLSPLHPQPSSSICCLKRK